MVMEAVGASAIGDVQRHLQRLRDREGDPRTACLIIQGAKGVEPFAECGQSCPAGVERLPLLVERVAGEALLVAERENRQAGRGCRSEEHTSELQSLMRITSAVFGLKQTQKKSTRRISIT